MVGADQSHLARADLYIPDRLSVSWIESWPCHYHLYIRTNEFKMSWLWCSSSFNVLTISGCVGSILFFFFFTRLISRFCIAVAAMFCWNIALVNRLAVIKILGILSTVWLRMPIQNRVLCWKKKTKPRRRRPKNSVNVADDIHHRGGLNQLNSRSPRMQQ